MNNLYEKKNWLINVSNEVCGKMNTLKKLSTYIWLFKPSEIIEKLLELLSQAIFSIYINCLLYKSIFTFPRTPTIIFELSDFVKQ